MLFVVRVLLAFMAKFLATFPVNYMERVAWGCWFAAALIWAWGGER
jgi:hypothetical protein